MQSWHSAKKLRVLLRLAPRNPALSLRLCYPCLILWYLWACGHAAVKLETPFARFRHHLAGMALAHLGPAKLAIPCRLLQRVRASTPD